MNETRNRQIWVLVLFSSVILGGAAVQVRGALVPSFLEAFAISEGQVGLLTPVGAVGLILAVSSIGLAAGRVDVKRFVLLGIGCTGVGLVAIGASPTYLILLGLEGARMLGYGMFRALDRPLISHLYPESRGRMFSLQTMTWAVGATAGPVFVTLVLARHSWRTVYLLLGVAFFPLLAVIWWLDVPDSFENEQSLSPSELKPFVKQPTIYGMGIALVIVGCIESVFFTWLPYYSAQFFTQSLATVSLSVYLVAYIPGRYVFSHLADRFPYTVLVRAVGGLTIAVLFGMFYLASGYQFLGLVFVSGLLISGLFPTLLTLGVEGTPEFSGPASALAMIFAQVGFFIGPAVVGVLADVYSIQQAMSSLQLLFAVLLTLVVLVLERRPLRHR